MGSMVPPTNTTLTYDRPGTMAIRTPGVPGSGGGGPIDMNALMAAARYKAQQRAWEMRQEAAMREREMALKERMQQAQLDAMTAAQQPPPGGHGEVAQRGAVQAQAMQERGEPIFINASGDMYTGTEAPSWQPGSAFTGRYKPLR